MKKRYFDMIEEEVKKQKLDVDLELIKHALLLAEESHQGQYRKSGEDYIVHPVEVTKILIGMRVDTNTIIAGILHDIVEDTLITIADIRYNFGDAVAELVDGVTKLKNLPVGTKQQYENLRKMILAMAKNINVVVIKLADRLHNMRTLTHMKPEKQISIAQETLDIYAPLAHRLGIGKIKSELEDLSLMYLHPKEYLELKQMISLKKEERIEYINGIIERIKKTLDCTSLKYEISGRAKHFYSIYKKIYEGGKSFDDIYDLMGVRIIAENKTDCYHILGVIQSEFTPVPGRFKDYIAVPKSNNYQSIHSTIIGADGKFVEIQIRTEEMDQIAEEGIAAHWGYKEKVQVSKKDQVYTWLRDIIENQQQVNASSEEFVTVFKEDLLKEEVFVFSPKGDVVKLTTGSNALDFAFHIHTNVGINCVGAKVNGRIVPLEYKLKNGDRVDIITSKSSKGPGKDWLNIVTTHVAKSKIRKWIKDQKFNESIVIGRDLIGIEIEKYEMTLKEFEESTLIKKYMEKHNLNTINDFYFHIADNRAKLDVVVDKIKEKFDQQKKSEKLTQEFEEGKVIVENQPHKNSGKKNDYGIVIDGVNNTLLKFAKCCTPLPGDEVGGYVTKLTGITIHRKDCPNFISMIKNDPGREIEVNWDPKLVEKKSNKYRFNFVVFANDRMGLIMDIVSLVANHKINLISINSNDIIRDGVVKIKMSIEISNKNEYKYLVNNILKLKDVISVDRA